jgi:hypothetical protein
MQYEINRIFLWSASCLADRGFLNGSFKPGCKLQLYLTQPIEFIVYTKREQAKQFNMGFTLGEDQRRNK